MNAFPPSSEVSTIYNPQKNLTGMAFDYANLCKLPFGSYSDEHKEYHQINTTAKRTRGVICLGPIKNLQGVMLIVGCTS
jgi:hypothetical protein